MNLVVWNSQGQKWDYLYTTGLMPFVTPPLSNTFGLTVEAGWAPWILPGPVTLGGAYDLDTSSARYNSKSESTSEFVSGFVNYRSRLHSAFWVPWVRSFTAKRVNTRCSLGGAYFPSPSFTYAIESKNRNIEGMVRPAIQLILSRNGITALSIYLVHFVSSYKAVRELGTLTSSITKIIDQGTPAIIVGDMNVNILKQDVPLAKGWRVIRTNTATHQSLSELDYGLLYDPNNNVQSTVSCIAKYKTTANPSDHSMLVYNFPGY